MSEARLLTLIKLFCGLLFVSFFSLNSAGVQASSTSYSDIVSAGSGLCISVNGGTGSAGTVIVQVACQGASNTMWSLVPTGNAYHIVSQASGMCLNVPGGSKGVGVQIIQYPCQSTAATNDQWNLVPVGNDYHIVSVGNGQCLNISGGAQTAGAAVIQYPCQGATALNDQFDLQSPALSAITLPSTWSPIVSLPVNPFGVANLPNGKLLMWSADQPFTFEGDVGYKTTQTQTAIFDPVALTSTSTLETMAGSDMFCPGTALLPNGQVLVNGGDSSPKTSLYNWLSNTWTAGATMHVARGYQGDTLLSNGAVFTLGGSWSGGVGGKSGETWTSNGGWTLLSGVPETNVIGPDPQGLYRGDNHLWLFAQSNGSVFHAGPSAQMNWITTSGTGSIQSAGNRGNDAYSINGDAVLFDIGKILKVGGAPAYQQNSATTTYASNSAYLIDITSGPNNPVRVTQLKGMTYPRAFANSVVLPNGNVVVVGGQTIPEPFTDTAAVLVPEIWNPTTQQFNLLNPMQVPRTYHSTAILLPDGRVFIGGGGQCGQGCADNHLDAQILTPPYLLTSNGSPAARPAIQAAPASAVHGESITVTTQAPVSSFVLMRLSSVTHTVNNDQRRIPLNAIPTGTSSYSLAIPSDPGIVLPGYYMLFALNSEGVPSVSVTLQISE